MRKIVLILLALTLVAAAAVGAAPIRKSNRLKPVRPGVKALSDTGGGPVLATADGKPYTMKDWNRDLPIESRQAARTTQDRVRTLDQLFEPKILLWAAERSGVGEDSLTAVRLENARKQILISAYLEKTVRPLSRVDSSAIARWYGDHPDDYRIKASVTARHIQVATRPEADKVRARLAKGEDFAALAGQISTDTLTRLEGGLLGSVTSDGFFRTLGHEPELADSLLALKEGELSRPLMTHAASGGRELWHIFRIDQKEQARMQPLDAVRDNIRQRLEREKVGQVYRAHLEELKTRFHFQPRMAVLGDSTLFLPSPEDLFRQAQATSDPGVRIHLYEDLLHIYPNSPFAEQAQFMIGFVYSEEMSDYDHAEAQFKKLIESHPTSELVKSAQWMLENMRKGTPAFEGMPDSLKAGTPPGSEGQKAPAAGTGGK